MWHRNQLRCHDVVPTTYDKTSATCHVPPLNRGILDAQALDSCTQARSALPLSWHTRNIEARPAPFFSQFLERTASGAGLLCQAFELLQNDQWG